MKLDSSTLFVNTGRKPLSAMQKKKTNKNTIALIVCIAIIAVLCIFVGLIANLWLRYNEETSPHTETVVTNTAKPMTQPKTSDASKAQKIQSQKKEKSETAKPKVKKSSYPVLGSATDISKAADKAFADIDSEYSFGIVDLKDGYTYINNTQRINNSSALGAFLMEYVSNAIYVGTFDYGTDVMGHWGRDLMTRAFSGGSTEAANLLIQYFGEDKLNAYFASKGYENTRFSGTIGADGDCYTTSEDLIKLLKKMHDNTGFFPYSDMYSKMLSNTVDNKIAYALPQGSTLANISFATEDETFDAAVVKTSHGKYIFVAMAKGGDIGEADNAIACAARDIALALTE